MNEYSHTCDNCGQSGNSTFARTFYKRLNDLWLDLCSECWEEAKKSKQ